MICCASMDVPAGDYDWVFCDVSRGPRAVECCLAAGLSMAAPAFSLFIDSASTYSQSFLLGERLIGQLSRSKVVSRKWWKFAGGVIS